MTEVCRRFQSSKRSRRRRGNKRLRVVVGDMSPICSEMCSSYSRYEERRRAEVNEFARAEKTTTTTLVGTEGLSCANIVEPSIAVSAAVITNITPPSSTDEDTNEASTSSSTESVDEDRSMTPTQLLQLSIRKRRALEQCKERPLDRELLLTGTIARLCTYIGEARARRRQERREAKRRREHLLHENDFDEVSDTSLYSGSYQSSSLSIWSTTARFVSPTPS